MDSQGLCSREGFIGGPSQWIPLRFDDTACSCLVFKPPPSLGPFSPPHDPSPPPPLARPSMGYFSQPTSLSALR